MWDSNNSSNSSIRIRHTVLYSGYSPLIDRSRARKGKRQKERERDRQTDRQREREREREENSNADLQNTEHSTPH